MIIEGVCLYDELKICSCCGNIVDPYFLQKQLVDFGTILCEDCYDKSLEH